MDLAKARTMSSIQKTAKSEDNLAASFGEEEQEWTLIEDTASGSISPKSWKPTDT